MKASQSPRTRVVGPIAPIGRLLTALGVWTASPWAFLAFAAYALSWGVFGSQELRWHEVATLATWLMTLCIQRAEHRDTQALQAKIDALIRALPDAEDALAHIDEEEPEVIERKRAADGR
jgi:low affinity Fe/Cu permease